MSDLPAQDARPSLRPVVLGFAFAGVLLLVLGYWAARRQASPPSNDPPTITLISPATDTAVSGSVTLIFATSSPLRLGAAGWATGRYHLHALLDQTELMPAASEITALGNDRYSWTVPAIRTGTLQLVWALPNHTRLTDGGSHTVRLLPR